MKKTLFAIVIILALFLIPDKQPAYSWGFFAHKKINRMAIFTLPDEMIGFYKQHIEYITEHAVDPDKRRYANEDEAPRHYIILIIMENILLILSRIGGKKLLLNTLKILLKHMELFLGTSKKWFIV